MSLTGKDMKRSVWLLWDTEAQLGGEEVEEETPLLPKTHPLLTTSFSVALSNVSVQIGQAGWCGAGVVQAWSRHKKAGGLGQGRALVHSPLQGPCNVQKAQGRCIVPIPQDSSGEKGSIAC